MKHAHRMFVFIGALFLCVGCVASNLTPTRVAIKQITRSATVTLSATPTPRATQTFTRTFTPAHTATRTATPAPTHTATRRATRVPQPTATFTPLPPLLSAFTPPFPDGWFHTVRFTPADVAPGEKYWRLVSATFCDVPLF